VLVLGIAALVVAIAIGGTHDVRRLSGSNGIGSGQFVAVVGSKGVLCQSHENVPAGVGFLRMTIGTYGAPGPALQTAVQTGDRGLMPVGAIRPGWSWKEGVVDLPLGASTSRRLSDVRICITNPSAGNVAVAGSEVAAAARVGTKPADGRVRFEFVRGKRQSAWSLAGTMERRMTFAHGLWAGLAPWAALALVLLAGAGAVRVVLRSGAGEQA